MINGNVSIKNNTITTAKQQRNSVVYFAEDVLNQGKAILINGKYYGGSQLIETTYKQLRYLKDISSLIPGASYRITDYVTTTIQNETRSAGHQFDIILTAISENEFNENAKACKHEGDTYFQNCDLNAWEIKYSIYNDVDRFAWADYYPKNIGSTTTTGTSSPTNTETTSTTLPPGYVINEEGKGVIYYMKDDRGNVCHYDFKNILFYSEDYGKYYFTFNLGNDHEKDYTIEAFKQNLPSAVCSNNIIDITYNDSTQILNNIIIFTSEDYKEYGCINNVFGINCKNIIVYNLINNCTFGSNNSHIELEYIENSVFKNNISCLRINAITANNVIVETNNNGYGYYCNINSNNEIYNLIISSGVSTSTTHTYNVETSENYLTVIERGLDGAINIYSDLYGKIEEIQNTLNTGESDIVINTQYDNKANLGGYYNSLYNYGLRGDNINLKKLTVYGDSTTTEQNLYCKVLIKVNDAWQTSFVSTTPMSIKANATVTFEMTKVANGVSISDKDIVAIVFIDDLSKSADKYITLRLKTAANISGCLSASGQGIQSTLSLNPSVNNFSPAISFEYSILKESSNQLHKDRDEEINSIKTFNSKINIANKTIITNSIDPGELKVLHNNSSKGFIVRTVNSSDSILPLQILSTNGSDSYQYDFPSKGGTVVLDNDLDTINSRLDDFIVETNNGNESLLLIIKDLVSRIEALENK